MRKSFRETDRIYRFGGEEFVLLLPGVGQDGAEVTLERFRHAVESFNFPQLAHVTVSIGVTSIRAGDTGSDAYGRADEALYTAKRGGRNQLCRYEALATDPADVPERREAQEIELF